MKYNWKIAGVICKIGKLRRYCIKLNFSTQFEEEIFSDLRTHIVNALGQAGQG